MNYALQQRLRFIDFALQAYGYVAPRYLCNFFGVSKPQGSLDFKLYNELHPGNMIYQHATLHWIATPTFKRMYP
jgi:hypothetical protein